MCKFCTGEAQLTMDLPDGQQFMVARHIEPNGTLENYLNVGEWDADGNLLSNTLTPEFKYCPECGARWQYL